MHHSLMSLSTNIFIFFNMYIYPPNIHNGEKTKTQTNKNKNNNNVIIFYN